MNLSRLFAIVCLGLGLLGASAPRAVAQGVIIPPGAISSPDLTQEQKDQVKSYVDANKDGLTGGPLDIKKSRNNFLQPLKNPQVSVAFRLEYTRDLAPILRPLLGNANEVIAVNAARVTGDLATQGSVELLADALKDKREGVRYAAASGFENTFKAMKSTAPALGGAQALKVIDWVQKALEIEKDPRVMEGLVLALQAATQIPDSQIDGMRDAGVTALARAIVAKKKNGELGPDADPALRRAILAIRLAVTNQDNIKQRALNHQTLLSGAEMAGDLLALASERLKGGTGAGDADLALMVSEAEKAIYFITPFLSSNPAPQEFKLWEYVQKSDANGYQQRVLQVIGPNGVLTTAPFNFPPDRFIKK